MIAVIVLLEPDLEEGRRNTESQKVYWDCDYLGFSWSSVCKNSYCFLPLVTLALVTPGKSSQISWKTWTDLPWGTSVEPTAQHHRTALPPRTGLTNTSTGTPWVVRPASWVCAEPLDTLAAKQKGRWWFWHGVFLCFFLKIDCEIISILRLVWEFRDDFACCNASHTCARCVVVIVLLVLLLVPLLLLLM